MLRLRLLSVALLLLLTVKGAEVTARVPGAEKPSCVLGLSTLGYPAHPSENFSKTFGVAPTKLAFPDSEHLVVTFISSDPGTASEREARPDSFRLRLHIVVFEIRTCQVDTKRDWPTPNPNDGVVAGRDGKIIVRTGNKLILFDTELAISKEVDATDHEMKRHLFLVFSSPSGRFLLLEYGPSSPVDYKWIDADNLTTLYSFSAGLFASAISDKEIIGWRQNSSHQTEIVIRKPDDAERLTSLTSYHSNKLAFVNEDTFAIESGYSPMLLVRTDGTAIKSLTPPAHEYFSRITPSGGGHRFAFTGSRIRNTSEILSPHQTWEYVQRVDVYDVSTDAFIGDLRVSHSGRNDDFPLALPTDGSMLAFIDRESLKVYRLPLASEPSPD